MTRLSLRTRHVPNLMGTCSSGICSVPIYVCNSASLTHHGITSSGVSHQRTLTCLPISTWPLDLSCIKTSWTSRNSKWSENVNGTVGCGWITIYCQNLILKGCICYISFYEKLVTDKTETITTTSRHRCGCDDLATSRNMRMSQVAEQSDCIAVYLAVDLETPKLAFSTKWRTEPPTQTM